MIIQNIWEVFPNLCRMIFQSHLENHIVGGGHEFDHVLKVGQFALNIAEDEAVGKIAAAAGLCHNADRIVEVAGNYARNQGPLKRVRELVNCWLNNNQELTSTEKPQVLRAVMHHAGRNLESDRPAVVALKDADRLANLELDVVIRAGQFLADLPALDPVQLLHDPQASFKDPKSVLRDICHCLEWIQVESVKIRLPKAMALAKPRADALSNFFGTLLKQRQEMGLVPYPDFTR